MSEEEKKAIECLKANSKDGDSFWYFEVIPNIKILLKLIDKQQKEIEELREKEKNLLKQLKDSEKELLEVTQNIVSKDKIRELKTKVEEEMISNPYDFSYMIQELLGE